MSVYSRECRVRAPLESVWAFHTRIDGLAELTPGVANLRIESVRGPDGRGPDDADRAELVEGTEIRLSVRPFGVGPRRNWLARIVERRREDGRAILEDELVDGPFQEWTHTHEFVSVGEETVVRDRVEYELPGGRLGSVLSPLAWPGFELAFRYRHRKTRTLLSG